MAIKCYKRNCYKQYISLGELIIGLIFSVGVYGIEIIEQNDIKQFTYNAAVVEYKRIENVKMSYNEKVNYSVHDYIRIMEELKEDVDIILFPEATLTPLMVPVVPEDMTEVPEPYSEVLCNSVDSKYLDFLKELSCAAVRSRTTLVINLIEKENCTSYEDTGYCPSTGFIFHNTDVVLNQEGSASARYRKYNLFGEPGLKPTPHVEMVNFTIKNNNSFGIFTCFDILFKKPALLLAQNGIRNILYPTMWYSELPYLTAIQVQQMWAQENNVTLISSGANNPREGSGGTGIYVGTKGPLNNTLISGNGGKEVLVQRVPKIQIADNPYMSKIFPLEEDIDSLAEYLDDFRVSQDPSILSSHTSLVLDTNTSEISQEVCNGNTPKICCQFNIKLKSEKTFPENYNVYTYHLAAFSGVRSFGGVRDGGIEACAVLACLNETVQSCGKRFPKYKDIYWPVTFEEINVSAEFQLSDDKIQFPNSLLTSFRPISPQYTLWTRTELGPSVRRNHVLKKPYSRILTFGIFGRDFSRDSPYPSRAETLQSNNITKTLLLILFVLVMLNKNKIF